MRGLHPCSWSTICAHLAGKQDTTSDKKYITGTHCSPGKESGSFLSFSYPFSFGRSVSTPAWMFGYNRKIYLYNHCSGAIERVLKKLEGIVGLSFFPYFFLSCPACSSAAAPTYFLFIYIFVRPQSEVPEHRPIYICVRVCLVYGLCLSLSERKNLLLEYIY